MAKNWRAINMQAYFECAVANWNRHSEENNMHDMK